MRRLRAFWERYNLLFAIGILLLLPALVYVGFAGCNDHVALWSERNRDVLESPSITEERELYWKNQERLESLEATRRSESESGSTAPAATRSHSRPSP